MNFTLYMIGVLVVVAGVAYGMSRLGLSTTWITIIVLIILGVGIMAGVSKTRQKEP